MCTYGTEKPVGGGLSPASVLAAAGYDMCLSLYSAQR